MTVETHKHMTPAQRALLARRLASARDLRAQSQRQVAAAVGVSRSAVANLERAAILPSVPLLVALATHYGVSVDWLLGLKGEGNRIVGPIGGTQPVVVAPAANHNP